MIDEVTGLIKGKRYLRWISTNIKHITLTDALKKKLHCIRHNTVKALV